MKVRNGKCIRRVSLRNLRTSMRRNIIASLAMVLTTVLFTSVFTIISAIANGYQQSNFRRIGSNCHGDFQSLTQEQYDILQADPAIAVSGKRIIVGSLTGNAVSGLRTEISYCSSEEADMMFLHPGSGSLPEPGSQEMAADVSILTSLGVPLQIGTPITCSLLIGNAQVEQTFTLSGWWETDTAAPALHALISEEAAQMLIGTYDPSTAENGCISLSIMLHSSRSPEQELRTILQNHGFQPDDPAADNYIKMGVNWGYLSSQSEHLFTTDTYIAIAALLLLIMFVGYLIICNIFRISVAGDIQRYGLLKTIGMTNRQIRSMVLWEAMLLACISIPAGLAAGCVIGTLLVPFIASQMNDMEAISGNFLLVCLFSALFALATVLISCLKPAYVAARTAPIEALRYNESSHTPANRTSRSRKPSMLRMALSNMMGTRRRTLITVLSLALSLMLFDVTYTLTSGFDMEQYLSNMKCDYIVANPAYFQTSQLVNAETVPDPDRISALEASGLVDEGGFTYGLCDNILRFVTKTDFLSFYQDSEVSDNALQTAETLGDLYGQNAMLYGMDDFVLGKLHVIEGDLQTLANDRNAIALVIREDDYGNPIMDETTAKIGDHVQLRYVTSYAYFNLDTGESYPTIEDIPDGGVPAARRVQTYTDYDYEIAVLVTVPSTLSFRRFYGSELLLTSETLRRDFPDASLLYYAFDTAPEQTDAAEEWLSGKTSPQFGYESRQSYISSFASFRRTFLLLGGTLCLIVGMVGLLNFINSLLTGILVRQREFAILRAIGMTVGQLRRVLLYEGMLYAAAALLTAGLLSVTVIPLLLQGVSTVLPFFSFHLTLVPLGISVLLYAVIGAAVPLVLFQTTNRFTIVETLNRIHT